MFEDPLQFNQLQRDRSPTRPNSPFEDQDWHFDLEYQTLQLALPLLAQRRRFLRSVRARPNARARAMPRSSAITTPSSTTRRASSISTPTLAYYTGLDTLPAAQEVQTQFNELASFNAELTYTNTTRSLGAVDHERGWRWNLARGADHANGETFPSLRGGLDFGVPLPTEQFLRLALHGRGRGRRRSRQPARQLLHGRLRQQLRR